MSGQNCIEVLDEIMEVLRYNSIGTIEIPDCHSQDELSSAQEVESNELSYDISPSASVRNFNDRTPALREIENFTPQSLRMGDIITIAIIVAAVQSDLLPAFDMNIDTIKYRESKTAEFSESAPSTSTPDSDTSEKSKAKNIFPSLSFVDARNSFCVTFSTISIFGEIVIYSSRKNFNEIKTKKNIDNILTNQIALNCPRHSANSGSKMKKKIQTLYLNPNDFISFFPIENIEDNDSKNISTRILFDENNEDSTVDGCLSKSDEEINNYGMNSSNNNNKIDKMNMLGNEIEIIGISEDLKKNMKTLHEKEISNTTENNIDENNNKNDNNSNIKNDDNENDILKNEESVDDPNIDNCYKNNSIITKINTEINTSNISPKKGPKKQQYITKLNKYLDCVQIGTYAVKFSVLTSRIKKYLLDPLLIEK